MSLGALALLFSVPPVHVASQSTGLADDGLPGNDRVASARLDAPGTAAFAATLRYGFTEGVLDEGEAHHRIGPRFGAAFTPLAELGLALSMDGQYHSQAGGTDAGDGGFLARTRVAARGLQRLAPQLTLGGQLALMLPAADSPSDALSGLGVGLDALLTYAASDALDVTASAGFRLDRSSEAIPNPARLSPADRLALDVADANALPLGLAVAHHRGSLSIFGEWSWQPRIGGRAQGALESPMWLTGGVRVRVLPSLQWGASLSVSPSARPDLASAPPLTVVEPRLWLSTGLVLVLAPPAAAPPPSVPAPAPPAPPPPEVVTAGVGGQVVRTDGVAVPGARVRVTAGDAVHEAVTDEAGHYELDGLTPGTYVIEVTAEGFHPVTQQVELSGGAPLSLPLALERELPDGHIRGHVQNYRGRGVASSVRIEPLGLTLETDAEGRFDVDVPPGEYRVAVEAPRYRAQERPAVVEQDGVTVLIIELRRAR